MSCYQQIGLSSRLHSQPCQGCTLLFKPGWGRLTCIPSRKLVEAVVCMSVAIRCVSCADYRGSLLVDAQPDRSHAGGCSLCAPADVASQHVEQGGAHTLPRAGGGAKVAS